VVFQDEQSERIYCRAKRSDLLKDVNAVLFTVNHPPNAAHLAFKPTEAVHQHLTVLGVTVSRVFIHTLGEYPI
jgi:hypothetical protein